VHSRREHAARGGEAPQLLLDGIHRRGDFGGVAGTGRAGQDTGDEGAPHNI